MKNQLNINLIDACRKGLADDVFCGVSAAVSIVKKGVRYRGTFSGGWTRNDHHRAEINEKSFFDLASLTKPLCTTLCILHLINRKLLYWDEPCLSLLKKTIPLEKKEIKLKHLLSHSSGLPAYRPYFEKFPPVQNPLNTSLIIQKILEEPLEYQPGTHCIYSDLGFILLGALIEKLMGMPIDRCFRKIITDHLQLSEIIRFSTALESLTTVNQKVAATENCKWRKKVIQGEVHDENCWVMGGIAGHAGLFATIDGVLSLCENLLDMWKDRKKHPSFSNRVLQEAFTKQYSNESWCLGFDSPTPGHSSCGKYLSPQSVGHLGFSGTSFWMDPEKNLIVVLLTNRVHPTRENIKIRQFRPSFHDYLVEKITAF